MRVLVANLLAVTALALALAGYIYLAVPIAIVAPRLCPGSSGVDPLPRRF